MPTDQEAIPIIGDHLRTHSPVAAVPEVAHFTPSVGPLAQTSPTRSSSSAQRTVSEPVTTRNGGAGRHRPSGREFPPDRPSLAGLRSWRPRSPAGPARRKRSAVVASARSLPEAIDCTGRLTAVNTTEVSRGAVRKHTRGKSPMRKNCQGMERRAGEV